MKPMEVVGWLSGAVTLGVFRQELLNIRLAKGIGAFFEHFKWNPLVQAAAGAA
jgi:hypothetical protein